MSPTIYRVPMMLPSFISLGSPSPSGDRPVHGVAVRAEIGEPNGGTCGNGDVVIQQKLGIDQQLLLATSVMDRDNRAAIKISMKHQRTSGRLKFWHVVARRKPARDVPAPRP